MSSGERGKDDGEVEDGILGSMNWCQLNRAKRVDTDFTDWHRLTQIVVEVGLEEDIEVVASGVENTGDVDFGFI